MRPEPLDHARSYLALRLHRSAGSLVAEARIELACVAYETALEPLQVLRNELAGEVGLGPKASALTVRHSDDELLANLWSGWLDSNQRRPASAAGRIAATSHPETLVRAGGIEPPAPCSQGRCATAALRPDVLTGSRGTIRTSID